MFRKLTIALIATAALGTAALAPTSASAWHGGGGGGVEGMAVIMVGGVDFMVDGAAMVASAAAPVSVFTTPVDAALGDTILAKNILGWRGAKPLAIK